MTEHYLSQDMALLNPPLDEFSDYFAEGKVHGRNNIPKEIIIFDIALLTLSEYPNLNDKRGLEYLAQFLNHFCPQNNHYNALSTEGKERIDSIFGSNSRFIEHVIKLSTCRS